MMLLAGAGLTTSYFDIGQSWKQVTRDTRIKAAVGYVPYFGQVVLPAFGHDQDGLAGINLPFLGISGTADTTAPIYEVQIGMSRLTGPRRAGCPFRRRSRVRRCLDQRHLYVDDLRSLTRRSAATRRRFSAIPPWGAWRAVAMTASCSTKRSAIDVTRETDELIPRGLAWEFVF